MHYFPSKKVVAVAIFALGVLAWVMYSSSSLTHLKYQAGSPLEVAEASSILPDSDNDGLFDWEETLLGTNKNDSDSDNDGVLDGTQYASFKKWFPITPTDNVLNYLSQLGNAVANGGDALTIPEPQLVVKPDVYSLHNISITEMTAETIGQYSSDVVAALDSYDDIFAVEILDTVSLWLETKGGGELETITSFRETLELAAADLSLITVPKDFALTHLELMNNLHKESASLKEMLETTDQSPAQGFLATAGYVNYRSKRAENILQIADQLEQSVESL